jgi:hypothetical protein
MQQRSIGATPRSWSHGRLSANRHAPGTRPEAQQSISERPPIVARGKSGIDEARGLLSAKTPWPLAVLPCETVDTDLGTSFPAPPTSLSAQRRSSTLTTRPYNMKRSAKASLQYIAAKSLLALPHAGAVPAQRSPNDELRRVHAYI